MRRRNPSPDLLRKSTSPAGRGEARSLRGFLLPSPQGGGEQRALRSNTQFVLGCTDGVATVRNSVASSTAVPIGVGTVMRNGTRIRVPAIGTKATSMLRWVVRYLITGRSGI